MAHSNTISIMIADDHNIIRHGLKQSLSQEKGMSVVAEANTGQRAIELVHECMPDVIIMDVSMPELNGIEATKQILKINPDIKIIALSMHSEKQFVLSMIKAGARGYILKTNFFDELLAAIRTVISDNVFLSSEITEYIIEPAVNTDDESELDEQTGKLKTFNKKLLPKIEIKSRLKHRFQNLIGKSDQMQKIYEIIEDLADVNANVLITGESGTGKELVAQALHYSGQRKDLPFVRVNCSALSENLLESELFGHVKGAFTGAEKNRIGRFQKAGKGSILLDEIGDITLHFQKRLLRVLQEREFEQLGDTKIIQMNARVIASTNKDLVKKVKDKTFRQDLYYRLKVMEIKIPPLRAHKEDISLLINHFLSEFNKEMSKNISQVSENTYKMLMSYDWPGNIRELKNIMEHAAVTCKNFVITPENLPQDFNLTIKKMFEPISNSLNNKDEIIHVLNKAKWNKTKAAKLLGISRRTLYRRLKRYSVQ
ncbi:MAG: sigma-54 dependent transcriptional regulator [Desulfobacterales bacterium]|nr:sigma-54 dependent transcriptional regulator [Desulfobacterales bacterium]